MSIDPITAGFVANVGSSAFQGLAIYVRELIGALKTGSLELTDAAEKLGRVAEELLALRDDYDQRVQQNKTKTTSNYYNLWVRRVTKILPEVKNLQTKCEQERSFLQKISFRKTLHGEVTNIFQRVEELLEDQKLPACILADKPPERVIKLRSVPDIKEFDTLQKHLEEILYLLSHQRINTIVIWGPQGVGKTTIMQNLNNHEKVAEMFEMVIWIKVEGSEEEEEGSKEKVEKLQKKIAKRLKLNLQGTVDVEENAQSISEELKKMKFLFLLDNFKNFIDLQDIGIPDNKNGSKVVLTTEFIEDCSKMELVREIEVKKLTPDEAWKMFKGIVKDKIDRPGVEQVARRVARECDTRPLFINMVANSFKSKETEDEWENGLEELRNWPEAFEIPEFREVHAFFKFCYDNLKNEKEKSCFLYGALHPANTKIFSDYLVTSWAAARFLGNIDGKKSLSIACKKGRVILKHLTNVSLLEAGKRLEHVTVNNMVRRVALHISSKVPNYKFLIGDQTDTSLASQGMSDWEQVESIFMIGTNLEELPNVPECCRITTVLKLKVLNLNGTETKSFPSSFSEWLTGLKALFLRDCTKLTYLPLEIKQSHHLEVLDIRGCKVIFIPTLIGKLVSLRCLRVSYFKPTQTNRPEEILIADNVITELSKLEELEIDVISYDQWCAEAINVIQQVASLEELTSLKICFPNTEVLRTLMESKPEWQGRQQLSVFWFFVGDNSKSPEILDDFSYPINRFLRYEYDGRDHDSSISNVLPETDALELIGHNKITCLSDFIKAPSLNGVRACLVESCSNMETVLDGNNAEGIGILPSLEQLHLRNLLHLKSIFEGPLSEGSLSKLHTIVVYECLMLIQIGMIQQLPNLKKLTIEKCYLVEKLIVNAEGNGSMQNLEILELFYLTDLSTICTDESLVWPHLKEFRVYECSKLKRLPFNREKAEELKTIQGEQAWWDSLEWVNDETREHFSFSPLHYKVSV